MFILIDCETAHTEENLVAKGMISSHPKNIDLHVGKKFCIQYDQKHHWRNGKDEVQQEPAMNCWEQEFVLVLRVRNEIFRCSLDRMRRVPRTRLKRHRGLKETKES